MREYERNLGRIAEVIAEVIAFAAAGWLFAWLYCLATPDQMSAEYDMAAETSRTLEAEGRE